VKVKSVEITPDDIIVNGVVSHVAVVESTRKAELLTELGILFFLFNLFIFF